MKYFNLSWFCNELAQTWRVCVLWIFIWTQLWQFWAAVRVCTSPTAAIIKPASLCESLGVNLKFNITLESLIKTSNITARKNPTGTYLIICQYDGGFGDAYNTQKNRAPPAPRTYIHKDTRTHTQDYSCSRTSRVKDPSTMDKTQAIGAFMNF